MRTHTRLCGWFFCRHTETRLGLSAGSLLRSAFFVLFFLPPSRFSRRNHPYVYISLTAPPRLSTVGVNTTPRAQVTERSIHIAERRVHEGDLFRGSGTICF